MLTVAFGRLGLLRGDRVLDLGCGGGRHAFEAWKRDATVVAFDRDALELKQVQATAHAMHDAGELPDGTRGGAARGDATALPFADAAFDRIVAAEVLEHVVDEATALAELARVLRPGGTIAVTVPAAAPERICWWLDRAYHDRPGGHVRIYRRRALLAKLRRAGLDPYGTDRVHAAHVPYWWLRCLVGVERAGQPAVRRYHDLLVRQIVGRARWLDRVERVLDPVLGKSLVVYAVKPA